MLKKLGGLQTGYRSPGLDRCVRPPLWEPMSVLEDLGFLLGDFLFGRFLFY